MGRRQRPGQDPASDPAAPPPHQDDERACARGDYCKNATVTWDENDRRIVHPALGYRAFCDDDRADIVTALTAFPGLYEQMAVDLHAVRSAEQAGRSAFGPRLPIAGDLDAAMRRLHLVLTSWEARIRAVPRIGLDDEDEPAAAWTTEVARAAATLHRKVDALLSLEPAWMPRYAPAARLRDQMLIAMPAVHPQDYWDLRRGAMVDVDVRILDELDGARAGLEILHLHYSCQQVLGTVERRPDTLLGVSCYRCTHKALRRADPPASDDDVLWYSQCKICGHRMTEPDYRTHVGRLAALVGGRRNTPALQLCTSRVVSWR